MHQLMHVKLQEQIGAYAQISRVVQEFLGIGEPDLLIRGEGPGKTIYLFAGTPLQWLLHQQWFSGHPRPARRSLRGQ